MTTAVRTPPHHNTLTCYLDYRCRRPECVQRMRDYDRMRRQAKANGTWQPLVDAEPVRQHLRALQGAGLTLFRVSVLAGLSDRTVRGFTERQVVGGRLLGYRHRTTPEIAKAILAVDPATAKSTSVDATASRRRIQALIAMGWPRTSIARRTGMSYRTLEDVLRRPSVHRDTADAVAAAYDELRGKYPTKYGVTPLQARKARNRAAANQWPPPRFWDDPDHSIDDPEFDSQYGISPGQHIADEARFLMSVGGLDVAAVAHRLGRSYGYIGEVLREFPPRETAA